MTETRCIEWQKSRTKEGYGRVKRKTPHGTIYRAHRLAWYEANGPIPDEMLVLHACDNPPCVNVEHLFLGMHSDNVADRVAKRRTAKGDKFSRKGENSPSAKLSEKQISEIRQRYNSGATQTHLSEAYGVTSSTISLIVTRKRWSHVP